MAKPDSEIKQPAISSFPSGYMVAEDEAAFNNYMADQPQNPESSFTKFDLAWATQGHLNSRPLPGRLQRIGHSNEHGITSRNEPTSSGGQDQSTAPVVSSDPSKLQASFDYVLSHGSRSNIRLTTAGPCRGLEDAKNEQRKQAMGESGPSRPTVVAAPRPSIGNFLTTAHSDGYFTSLGPPALDLNWHSLCTTNPLLSAAPTLKSESSRSWVHSQPSLPTNSPPPGTFQLGHDITSAVLPARPRKKIRQKIPMRRRHHRLAPPSQSIETGWSFQDKHEEFEMALLKSELREEAFPSEEAESSNISMLDTIAAIAPPPFFFSQTEEIRNREHHLREVEAKSEKKLNENRRNSNRSSLENMMLLPPPQFCAEGELCKHHTHAEQSRGEKEINNPAAVPSSNTEMTVPQHTKTFHDLKIFNREGKIQSNTMADNPYSYYPASACHYRHPPSMPYIPTPRQPTVLMPLNPPAASPAPSTAIPQSSVPLKRDELREELMKETRSRTRTQIGFPESETQVLNATPATQVAESELRDLDAEFSDVMLVSEDEPSSDKDEDEDWIVI